MLSLLLASLTLSGRIFTDQYLRTQTSASNPDTISQSSFSSWLELNSHTKSSFNIHAVGSENLFLKSLEYPHTTRGEFKLREGYASYSSDSLEVKAGQQIIPWGKSDGVNPTDYFTAKDYTLLNPDEEVKRMGAPSLSFSYTPLDGASPLNFQFIAQTSYPRAKLLIPDSSIPAGIKFTKFPTEPSLLAADSSELGIKVSYLKSNYDFSISAFRGFAQMPHYEFDGAQIRSIYYRETALGGDLSTTLDAYIIRLESAVHLPDDGTPSSSRFGLLESHHWDSVLGIERPVLTDFRIQVQGLVRYHFYYSDYNTYSSGGPLNTAIQRAIGKANALILNTQDQTSLGATLRFGYAPENGDFSADLFLIGYVGGGGNYIFRPQASYKALEGLKFTAGAEIYGGVSDRPFGALKDFSSVFFEGKWLF